MTRPHVAGSASVHSILRGPGAWRRLAGGILVGEGLLALRFAVDNNVAPLLVAVPLIAIVTGVGVYRQVDSATAIGLMLAGLLILNDLASLPAAIGNGASQSLPGIAAELLANLVVVYALLRRGAPGSGPPPRDGSGS